MREQICKYCGKIFNKPHKPKQQYCSILCGRYSQIVLDNNIFETIDNVSAYVLGLIWADGNIYTPKHGRTRTLLDITSKDFQLIEQVHKILTPSKKLYSYQPKQGNRVFSIKTRDPRIINQLIAYGLCEKKSYIISWPTLELGEFKSSFIRGVFDGDGCVSTNKRNKYKYLRVSFTGCRNPFFEQLYKELQIFKPKWYNDKRTEAWKIEINRKRSVQDFGTYIYKSGNLCLMRKKRIFLKNGYLATEPLLDGRRSKNGLKKN